MCGVAFTPAVGTASPRVDSQRLGMSSQRLLARLGALCLDELHMGCSDGLVGGFEPVLFLFDGHTKQHKNPGKPRSAAFASPGALPRLGCMAPAACRGGPELHSGANCQKSSCAHMAYGHVRRCRSKRAR